MTLNKNSVPGDKSAMVPGGVRIGSPAMTTRGMVESDFVKVADFIDRYAMDRELSSIQALTELNDNNCKLAAKRRACFAEC